MRHKKFFGFFFLIISIISLTASFNFTLTGNVIGTAIRISYFYFISLVFFISSILIFASKQTLEAIIIPTGTIEADILRTEKAEKEKKKLRKGGYFVISGHYPHGSLEGIRKSQDYRIYKHLRENGIIPTEMMVEGQSHDTLENTLYSLKKIRQRADREGRAGTLDVGIVTYHDHFKRFKDFYEKAVEKGMLKRGDFRLHKIQTEETKDDKNYEANLLRRLSHQFKLATIGRYKSKEGSIKQAERIPLILKIVNRLRGK